MSVRRIGRKTAAKGRIFTSRDILSEPGGSPMFRIVLATAFAALSLSFAAPAQASPAQCVYPDGSPCTPAPQGCVLPENGLPCTSRLEDVNAAIRQQLGQVLGGVFG